MSLKYSSTTADYLQWSEAMNLVRKLARDSNYKMSLLIALGCFTGLRISDILALRWNQILDAEEFTITEIKTGKQRTIRINMQLQQHIRDCYEHINPVGINAPVLISQKGGIPSGIRSAALSILARPRSRCTGGREYRSGFAR